MINSKQDLKYYLEADKIALGMNRKKPHLISIWESDIIWKYQILLRKNEYFFNTGARGLKYLYYKFLQYRLFRMQAKYLISVPINVFGPGFSISHLGPITINGHAKVGKNCRLHPFTCIGVDGRGSGTATLGDNVYISTGVKIIGEVNICDDVCLAANSVVVKDIAESGTTWGGVPAKKISDNGSPFPISRRGADITDKKES